MALDRGYIWKSSYLLAYCVRVYLVLLPFPLPSLYLFLGAGYFSRPSGTHVFVYPVICLTSVISHVVSCPFLFVLSTYVLDNGT